MTVRFFLVRHGRAQAGHPQGDAARRLLPGGRDELAAHFRALANELRLARIATSPLLRARESADILAEVTGAPVVDDDALASGKSSGAAILGMGARLGDGTALVGHNPELAEAVAVAAGRQVEVPPGAVAAIDVEGSGFRLAWIRAPG